MPFGRYPDRVKEFQDWARKIVLNQPITKPATVSRARKRVSSKKRRRRRRRKNRWLKFL